MHLINIKTCLTCSSGGHLHELLLALKEFEFSNCYWLTYKSELQLSLTKTPKAYFVTNTDSANILTWIVNALQSLRILMIERPKLIVSSGAGVSFPTIFLGKLLFGAKVIYVVTAADVTDPSRTTTMSYRFSDLFLVQWPELQTRFPKSKYIGLL